MPVPVEAEVRAVLGDAEDRLRAVIDRAWAEWQECELRGRLIFARAKSDVIFDFIARHALAEFGDDKDVYIIAKQSTVKFLFRDQVLLRFKKGNAKGVGSNIETQATLDFIEPERKLFPDLPDILKVEVCYQPDKLGAQIKEVAVVARDRRKRIWAYPLSPAAGAEVISLGPRTTEPTPPVVVVRKTDEKSETAE